MSYASHFYRPTRPMTLDMLTDDRMKEFGIRVFVDYYPEHVNKPDTWALLLGNQIVFARRSRSHGVLFKADGNMPQPLRDAFRKLFEVEILDFWPIYVEGQNPLDRENDQQICWRFEILDEHDLTGYIARRTGGEYFVVLDTLVDYLSQDLYGAVSDTSFTGLFGVSLRSN